MKQKLLIVLAFVLICTISKVQAYSFSAVAPTGQTLYYNITSSTAPYKVAVTGGPILPVGALTIPDTVINNGIKYYVTSLADASFYQCSGLTSCKLGDSITSIGANAFYGCSGLKSIVIPNLVTSIYGGTFFSCQSLDTVTIGNSVNFIEDYAFGQCNNLKTLNYNSINYTGSYFIGRTSLQTVVIGNDVDTIPWNIFMNCTGLTSLTMGNSVKSVGQQAFYGCSGLTSVIIPASVKSIGDYAFSNCSGLTSILIPDSVESIGSYAFAGCDSIDTLFFNPINCTTIGKDLEPGFKLNNSKLVLNIGNQVKHIPKSAFQNCNGLSSVIIPSTVVSIGNHAFKDCIYLDSVYFNPINCIAMGNISEPVFKNCNSLKYINIGNQVINIPSYAFNNCRNLTSIIISNSVKSIGYSSFWYCTALSSINLPNSVTSIGDNAFCGCSSLTSFTTPDSLTFLSNYLFRSCASLNSIILGNSIDSIGQLVFYNCNQLSSISSLSLTPPSVEFNSFITVTKTIPIYVPCPSKSNYQTTTYWSDFINFVETKNTQNISASICQGEIYTNHGANIDSAGVYTLINGCDSIILNLTVNPIYSTEYNDTICQGQTYNNYGFNFIADTTEVYTQNLQTINGCDSIITLNLTVNPIPTTPNVSLDRIYTYIEITWDGNGDRYEVYRNDSLIASTSHAIYLDTNVVNDSSYCYKVKAFIGNCESDFSNTECMQFVGLNDINNDNQKTTLYPNPTSSNIYLKIDQSIIGSGYTITNTLGKILLKGKLLDVSMNINLNDFPQGIYFLNIEKTKQTLKVIKQ